MSTAFDHIAADYDMDFTLSETGKLQRKRVIAYVEKKILKADQLCILELNCGTGEDAIRFHKAGHEVCATDISAEMIMVAKAKQDPTEKKGITFIQLSFNDLPQEWMKGYFDLVFSNFGGLNCINEIELERLFKTVKEILKPQGRFVGVIMPRYCLWEIFYFTLKGQWNKVFRRKREGPVTVMLQEVPVKTWYYSPKQIKNMKGEMEIVAIRPVGLLLPPSFLEDFFKNKKKLLKFLFGVEKIVSRMPFFAGLSDHFLFDMINIKSSENKH